MKKKLSKPTGKPDYTGHDMNFVEWAVDRLGGIAETAKAMSVRQSTVKRWSKSGQVSERRARELETKAGIWWKLLRYGPHYHV
jgi:hypothetical protein